MGNNIVDEDEDCWNQLELQGCAEFWNISTVLRLSESFSDIDSSSTTSVGFTHLKWVFGCEPPYLGMLNSYCGLLVDICVVLSLFVVF